MTVPEHPQSDREISYRIGWKKGKIHVPAAARQDEGKGEAAPSAHSTPEAAQAKPDPLLRLIWRRAPYPVWSVIFWTMVVLPAAAFAAVVWLVARLSSAGG